MHGVANTAFAEQLRAAAERTLDTGHRHDGEATLRPPGRRREGVQSRQAGSSVARVSHLFCGQYSTRAGRRSTGWQPDGVIPRTTGVVEIHQQPAGGSTASLPSRRLRLGDGKDDDRGRRAEDTISVQVETNQQGQATDPTGILARGLDGGGTRLEGSRGGVDANGLDPPAPGDRAPPTHPGRTRPGGKETPGGDYLPGAASPWFCRD